MTKWVGWVILRSVLLAAVALLVFLTALFFFLQAQGVDLSTFYGPYPSTQNLLHHPSPGQRINLVIFWKNMLTGNLGVSFSLYPLTVWSVVAERLPRSLFLFTLALLAALPLGRGLSRLFQSRWGGNGNRFVAMGIYAVFLPWLALFLIWLFAYKLNLLPIGKFITSEIWRPYYHEISANAVFWRVVLATSIGLAVMGLGWLGLRRLRRPTGLPAFGVNVALFLAGLFISIALFGEPTFRLARDMVWHMVLPFITLAVEMTVFYALVIHSDLFRFRPFKRDSFTPFFALFLALSFGALLNVETVYSWPGIGLTMFHAILAEDMPLAVGAFTYIVIALIFINMAMAISRGLRDLWRLPTEAQSLQGEADRRARWPLVVAAALFLAFVGMAVAHPLLMGAAWDPAVYDPVTGYEWRTRDHPMLPSTKHLLGTDAWGRDVLSQLLYSAQSALRLGGLAGLIALILGLAAALLLQALEAKARSVSGAIIALGCALLALPLLPLFTFASIMVSLNLYTLALWLGLFTWPLVLFILRGRPGLLADRIGLLKALAGGFLYIMAISVGIEAVLSFYDLYNIWMSWGIMVEMASISGYLVGGAVTRYWWLFWPPSFLITLFGFAAYLLGWELKARVGTPRPTR